jgi:hypothetical protein
VRKGLMKMKRFAITMTASATFGFLTLAALWQPVGLNGAEPSFRGGRKASLAMNRPSGLHISREPATGKVTVFKRGHGVMKQSTTLHGRFKRSRMRGASHVAEPVAEQMLFRLEAAGGQVISVNIVGYINLPLPPGLSLVANQLFTYDNTLAALIYNPPDGAQVYKYVSGAGYEISTFDGLTQTWTNPDMDLSPGVGFFFNNPTPNTIVNTFVGEVHTGVLVTHLPAGFSTKGALVPQQGSINTIHNVPGQPGDVLRLYVNDLQGGGDYVTSVFSATENAWVPDLTLQVGQGLMTEMQAAQDWVRIFHAN